MQYPYILQVQAVGLAGQEKFSRLLQVKSQRGGVYLRQLSTGAQRCERKRRLGSRGQHDMRMRRRVPEKKSDRFMDHWIGNPVIILQEQVNLVFDVGQVIDQRRYDRLRVDEESFIDQVDRVSSNPGRAALNSLHHVEEKAGRLVNIGVDGQTRD